MRVTLTIPPPDELLDSCPNAGCSVKPTCVDLADHLKLCKWQDVTCPSPGCNAVMPRVLVPKHLEDNLRIPVPNAAFRFKIQDFEMAELREYNTKLLIRIHGLETASISKAVEKFRRASLGDFQYSTATGRVVLQCTDRKDAPLVQSSAGMAEDLVASDAQVAEDL